MNEAQKAAALAAATGDFPLTQARLDVMLDVAAERFGRELPTQVLVVWELERHGGACPLCSVPWVAVHANHATMRIDPVTKVAVTAKQLSDFTYYRPGCKCFKRCTRAGMKVASGHGKTVTLYRPGCGQLLVAERLLEMPTCINCGGLIT